MSRVNGSHRFRVSTHICDDFHFSSVDKRVDRRAQKSRECIHPARYRNPHPRAISDAHSRLYTMYICIYIYVHRHRVSDTHTHAIGALLRTCMYTSAGYARMHRAGICVEDLGNWTPPLFPPRAHINQKLRFRPSPKRSQVRNLDAPGVPEVISPRRE